ncbi:ABC transporter permease [Microbacterium sp. NPDC091313]
MIVVITKLVRAGSVFFAVTLLTFLLVYSNGPGIARAVVGINANEDDVQRQMTTLGLDQPVLVQYGHWLIGLFRGDLGVSYFTGQPVTDALAVRVPVTLSLVVITLILTAVISIVVGVAAAVYSGWLDRILQFTAVLGAAVPSFIIAIGLVFLFALTLRLFPATGYVAPERDPGRWLLSLTLPVLAILIGAIGSTAIQFRGSVRDVLARDYIRTLRARGVSSQAIVFRHALRNAAAPGLTSISFLTISLLGGAVIVEQVFALPGLGSLSTTAVLRGDIPIVMGTVAVAILVVLIVNVLTDLLLVALNPKARTS